jgi:hypothetical protein
MGAMSASVTYMVIRDAAGRVRVLAAGELQVGAIMANPSRLTVSPPTVAPPRSPMTGAAYAAWLASLRQSGSTVTEEPMQ